MTQAQAVILLNPLDGNPFSTSGRGDSLTNLETEAQLVRSFDVTDLVRQKTGIDTSNTDLLANLEVSSPTNTQLLEITYSDLDPAKAVEITQAFADEFLAFRESNARSLVDGQIELINQQIADRKTEQEKLSRELAKAGSTGQTAVLQTQLDAITTQINQLRARTAELQIGPFNPGQVVTPAKLHREGILDAWYAYAVLGAVIGAAIALLVSFVRSRTDTRIHHVDDVLVLGRQILGQVSQQDAASVQGDLGVIGPINVSASFRDLRVAVLTKERRRPAVVMLASASSDPTQVPLCTGGLAVAVSKANLRTVVVDTTASWPFPEGVGADRESLAALLSRDDDLSSVLIEVSDNLRVVSAQYGGDGADLFMSPAMGRLVERLRRVSDIIFVVSGGIRNSASMALADKADVLITEVIRGHSHVKDVTLPESLDEKDLGVVLVTGSEGADRDSEHRGQMVVRSDLKAASAPGSPRADGSEGDEAGETFLGEGGPSHEAPDHVAQAVADGAWDGESGPDESSDDGPDSADAAAGPVSGGEHAEADLGNDSSDGSRSPEGRSAVGGAKVGPSTIPQPSSTAQRKSRRRRTRRGQSVSETTESIDSAQLEESVHSGDTEEVTSAVTPA